MKKILIVLIIFLSAFIYVSDKKVVADSGWDSSYSGGGGSSWDSSDSGSGSSSSSNVSGAIYIIVMAILMYVCFNPIKNLARKVLESNRELHKLLLIIGIMIVFNLFAIPYFAVILWSIFFDNMDKKEKIIINEEELKKYGITNVKKLKKELFDNYVKVQIGWMNVDYDALKPLLSDELYNQYKSQLEVLELKGSKNIMSNFEYVDSKIIDIRKINNKIILKITLNVKMYDYVIDNTGKIIQGSNKKRINIKYNITFEKELDSSIKTCPNCGAKITRNNRNECPNCKSIIITGSKDYVMSKKENIGQSWE